METIAREVRVRGTVQGVGFRYFTKRRARELGLAGWVENLADGSVLVHAEGPSSAVIELEAWLAHGPTGARVLSTESRERSPLGLTRFDVRRASAGGG